MSVTVFAPSKKLGPKPAAGARVVAFRPRRAESGCMPGADVVPLLLCLCCPTFKTCAVTCRSFREQVRRLQENAPP